MSASYDLYPQHCLLPDFTQEEHAIKVCDELVTYFDGVFFLREIGEETMLGVEVVRYGHTVRTRVDNIKFIALVMIEVGAVIPCVQSSHAP